jgi:hypothetical protein
VSEFGSIRAIDGVLGGNRDRCGLRGFFVEGLSGGGINLPFLVGGCSISSSSCVGVDSESVSSNFLFLELFGDTITKYS